MIRGIIKDFNNVRVDCFGGLLVDYAKSVGANVILRGLRAVSDFEYEFQLALINRRLNREIETVFLMTGYKWFYTSSTIINEAASFGGSVKGLVPEIVNRSCTKNIQTIRGDHENRCQNVTHQTIADTGDSGQSQRPKGVRKRHHQFRRRRARL